MKNLKNWQKGLIATFVLAVIIVGGVFAGKYVASVKNPNVTVERFADLISKDYSISDFKEDAENISMNIKMDSVEEKDLEALSDAIYEKCVKSGWTQTKVNLNIFTGEPTKFDFYAEGLTATIDIDLEKNKSNIGSFTDIPSTKKATMEELNTISNEIVENADGNIVISLDMKLEEDSNEASVMSQSLAYTTMVKQLNKDVNEVTLKINQNEDKSYQTNTGFDKLVKTVTKYKLEK